MKFQFVSAALVAATIFTACDNRPETMAQAATRLYTECDSNILQSCFKALSFYDSIEILSPKDRYRFGQAVGFGNSPESFAKTNIELTKDCHTNKRGLNTATSCIKALTLVSIVARMSPEEKKRFEDAGGFKMPSENQDSSEQQPSESVEDEQKSNPTN